MKPMWMAVLLCGLLACVPKETKVQLSVEVKTNQGEPVHAATVLLDGKNLGATSNSGAFSKELSLPAGARKRLEIHKDSDTYYFAPYYQAFVVDKAGPQALAVAATLYFVPKPAPPGDKTGSSSSSAAAGAAAGSAAAPAGGGAAASAAALADKPEAGDAAVAAAPAAVDATTAAMPQAVGAALGGDAATTAKPKALAAAAGSDAATAAKPKALGDAAGSDAATAAKPKALGAAGNSEAATAAKEPLAAASAAEDASPEVQPKAAETPAVKPNHIPIERDLAARIPAPSAAAIGAYGKGDDVEAYPRVAHANQGAFLFTIHAYAGSSPLAGVDIAMGEGDSAALKAACTTNERGRCVIRFATKPEALVTFVATKKGYKTAVTTVPIQSKDKLRINLELGRSLDVYALTRSYNHSSGLPGVEVRVAGKRVGETDRFGRYTYIYGGKADDLLSLSLKPRGYLPEVFETDFVAAGELQLVKTFAPDQPPSVRMTVLSPLPAGNVDRETLTRLSGPFGEALRGAARRHLYATSAFKEYPFTLFDQSVHRAGKTTAEVLRSGWQATELKAQVDAVLVPTVVTGGAPTLELSVVDSEGRVLAAAKEELSGLDDKGAVDRAVEAIAKKITRVFPFEGAVLGKEGTLTSINLGQNQGRGVQVGDVLDIYGQQTAKLGRSQLHGKIATLTVREVGDQTAKCSVKNLAPRATIERGDIVVLRPRRELKDKEQRTAALMVLSEVSGKKAPVAQANVYLNNQWIGATDNGGRLYVEGKNSGSVKVIKQGYADATQTLQLGTELGKQAVVLLKRQAAFLRVDSRPTGAVVKVEGKVLGKTPLAAGVPVPSGFVKLEIEGPAGYKPYSTVLELDQGTLDLTGEAAVALEQDLRALAQRLIKVGKTEAALGVLNKVPSDHSDYLMARHEAGELYLTVLDEPAKAAEAFGQVTANPAVKEYADKRFIGSHIDEGIALFLTAERLSAEKPEAAQAHYKKALEVLDGTVPYLRFVAQAEYAQAVHNVDYHRALCRHRLWALTQDPRLLVDTVKTWKSYLDGSARSIPAEGPSKAYVENAAVYFKQASASLNAGRNVSRQ